MTGGLNFESLCSLLQKRTRSERTSVVAISGFGGSGKSTLANRIRDHHGDVEVVCSDDFSVGQQGKRCDDWSSIDRKRLREQVLVPARAGHSIRYQLYDWSNDVLGDWRDIGSPELLVVEGIGIIHPDLSSLFEMMVWVDVPLEIANERARRRDKEIYQVDHDALWRDLWTPNDRDYFERFRPDRLADVIYLPDHHDGPSRVEHEVAIVVLRDRDGHFFIHQRRADKNVFPLKWGVGAGGKVERGESPDVAARRELREETGIDASPSYRFTMTYEDGTVLSLMHVFDLEADPTSVVFDKSEWCDSRWVRNDELTELAKHTDDLCPDTAAFIQRYLEL